MGPSPSRFSTTRWLGKRSGSRISSPPRFAMESSLTPGLS